MNDVIFTTITKISSNRVAKSIIVGMFELCIIKVIFGVECVNEDQYVIVNIEFKKIILNEVNNINVEIPVN